MIDAVINGNFMMRSGGRGFRAPHRFILVKTPVYVSPSFVKFVTLLLQQGAAAVRRSVARRGRIPLEMLGAIPISCPCFCFNFDL